MLPTGNRALAQEDPGFATLAYLAESDPDAALDRISEILDGVESGVSGDPRVVFDLYRLAADLMIEGGQVDQAAQIIARLAGFAAQFRAVLDIDPAPIFAEAAALLEDTGQLREARDVLLQLLAEQRAGARPPEVTEETLADLARVSDALGQPMPDTATAGVQSLKDDPTRGETGGFHEVDVYYATDRARSGKPEPAEFYGGGRGELELGVATVTIPEQHTPGVVEAPSIWRLEFRADPARHVVLQSVTPLDPDSFYGRLQSEFEEVPEREAFVFIHGYNVRFDQAARRAAQIAYDMNYAGVPILYSWPSRGSTVGYVADTAVVRLSGRRLSRFLEDLAQRSGAETIHIVAHSMGNRALTDALELMALRLGQQDGDAPVFGQVLFAAPDVDAGLFAEMLPTIRPLAQRLTLYASEEDWALAASRKLHGNALRAGMGGDFTLTNPAIDSIDMSELGDDMLAHSYFADDSSALADMMTLFWQNTDPAGRCGLSRRGDDAADLPVWHYDRGICADRQLIDVLAHLRQAKVSSLDEARVVLGRTVADAALAEKLEQVVTAIVGN
ncbi:alpha/beta hydrolase [Seohaeicola saemankumensis]|nr:alpha/beta hydrolase [Seohaeicola saemankumensis]MCA0871121.1 alpha/beta hydrolase [Seohaeicola saemankumensis]